jgi:hypothetical protein
MPRFRALTSTQILLPARSRAACSSTQNKSGSFLFYRGFYPLASFSRERKTRTCRRKIRASVMHQRVVI